MNRETPDGPATCRSVRNAFRVLDVLAGSSDGLRLARIVEATGLPKSSAHRILATLEELDIVCRDKRQNELVFIEVKTRTSEDFGRPLDAVDRKKRRLILRGAMTWLRMLDMPDIVFRFDIVEVIISSPTPVRHIENAFRMPDNYSY